MTLTADRLPLLMALRVQGRATSRAVAVAAGVSENQAQVGIEAACGCGAAERAGAGGACGEESYRLTEAGRSELAAMLAAEEFERAALAALYQEFLTIDFALKQGVTAWQLRSQENRSADATNGLQLVGTRGCVLVEQMARLVPRYAPYTRRLRAALEALARGDGRFVADTQVGSLHQVWFELHQDLLLTLGRLRTPCAHATS